MSVRLVELFGGVGDIERFLADYRQSHVPLARALPGVRQLKVARSVSASLPSRYQLMVELEFDGVEELEAALVSEEAKRTAEHIQEIHDGTVDFCVLEGAGEERGR